MNAYADLTTIKSASYLDISATTHDTYLRELLEDASRRLDRYCNRFFYVRAESRYYDGHTSPWLLPDDILSITTLKVDENDDGTYENTYTENTDFYLKPYNEYPKTRAEIRVEGSYGTFGSGLKKTVEIDGFFGYGDGWSASPYATSGGTGTVATATGTALTLSSANLVIAGQTILCESEQMYVESVSSTTATVKREVNGTTGVAHTTKTIYIYEYPTPITEACLITAMRAWKRKDSAYQNIVGTTETGMLITTKGIDPDVAEIVSMYRKNNL